MQGVAAVVAQQTRGLVDVVHDDVEVAVVVQVSEGRATGAVQLLERRAALGLDLVESPLSVVVEQLVPLLPGGPQVLRVDVGEHVPIGDEDVLPAVVVVVDEADTPAKRRQRREADAGDHGDIGEHQAAVVVTKRAVVVREVGDD